jgi:hypothetical protein
LRQKLTLLCQPSKPARSNGRALLAAVLAVELLLASGGCSTANNLLPNRSTAELRKKVEADHFPTAEQAGVK